MGGRGGGALGGLGGAIQDYRCAQRGVVFACKVAAKLLESDARDLLVQHLLEGLDGEPVRCRDDAAEAPRHHLRVEQGVEDLRLAGRTQVLL